MPAPDANEPNGTALSQAHLRHHGFRSQPFDGLPNTNFVYRDSAMDVQIKLLRDRLRTDDRLLLLIGDSGVGKSTHVQRLLEPGAGARFFCAFHARPGATFAAIETALREHWTLSATQGRTEMPVAEFLSSLCREEERPILVIDDAHHLAPAVLAAIQELRQEVRRHCGRTPGVLLAGTSDLGRLIEAGVDGDAAVAARMELFLQPLTGEQTEAYLRHRLQAAGAKAPDLLGGAIARAIHQESAGHPRDINRIANRYLQDPATPTATAYTVSPLGAGAPSRILALLRNPRAAGLALAGALGGLVLLVLISSLPRFPDDSDANGAAALPLGEATLAPPAEEPRKAPVSPQVLTPEPQAWVVTEAASAETLAPDAPAAWEAEDVPLSRPHSGLVALTESLALPDPGTVPHAHPASAPDAAPGNLDAADPALARRSEVPGSGAAGSEVAGSEITSSEVLKSDTVPTRAVPAETAPAVPVATVSVRVESAPAASTEAEPEPSQPQPLAQPPAPKANPATPARLQETNWLRDQNANHLSVQIVASHDLQALQELARTLRLDAELAWFQTRREGRDWYTLVVGPYPSVARARAAVTELPAAVQRQQPWVRSFASIHKALDEPN